MTCSKCGGVMGALHEGEWQTCVGYFSPPGHVHDDNCLTRTYGCDQGHTLLVSVRRRCPTAGCEWRGKAACFCHPGDKMEAWPDAPSRATGAGKEGG